MDRRRNLRLEPGHDALSVARATVLVPGDAAARSSGNELLRARRTPSGLATLWLRHQDGHLEARAWGSGADWALEQLPELIGMHDQTASRFDPGDGPLRSLYRRRPDVRVGRAANLFEAVIGAVLLQKVVGKEASRSYRRLCVRYGDRAPGPGGLSVPPTAETLLQLGYEYFHPLGVERRRAETVRRAARVASRLEEALELPREDAEARLCTVPGIGAWTAAKVCYTAAGDPDAVWVGDYHLPNVVAYNLAGEPRASDERMLELLEPWRGHRARVVRLIEREGTGAPRYGPRMEFRDLGGTR